MAEAEAQTLSKAPSEPVFVRGWVTVVVCLLGISTGPAAFGLSSLFLLGGPIGEEFGWSRTAISAAVSVMMLCTAVSLPFMGRLVDRFGVKQVLVPSIVIFGLCFLAASMISSYWQFIALYVAMGTIAVGTNSVPYMRVLTAWFDRRRGLAIGIAGSGTGLGFGYVPLITQEFVSHYGWRGGYFGLGLIMLLFTLPMVVFLLHEKPQSLGLHPDGAASDVPADQQPAASGDTLPEAMRRRDFWSLITIFSGLAFVLYGLIPHMVPMLQDRGVSVSQASWLASAFGWSAFGGRLLIGFLVDRHDARRIAFVFFSLSAIGLGLLSAPLPVWVFTVAAIMLGLSLGAEVDMLAYLTSRYFGLKNFAQIFGAMFSAVMVAMSLSPLAFGAVYDSTGSYQSILALGVPLCVLAIVLVLMLRPYGERARGGPISVT
ncbi:MFS transporter [Steroidobacter cummioxidans]|uniref:MFS transporter n=1 Tax=Steroidobacter cummioxidans TaxID=1803913 RepID=UPI000E318A31|nr:MFS transporter [Steroidobacter cummioxidans]